MMIRTAFTNYNAKSPRQRQRLAGALTAICVYLRSSAVRALLPCISLLVCQIAVAEDRAVIVSADGVEQATLVGMVTDYNGKELVFQPSTGSAVTIPATRVLEVISPGVVTEQDAAALVKEHKYDAAIEAYRKAMNEEQRPWVRRRILADVVTCYENAGQIDRAGDTFLGLMKADEHKQYFDRIPLAWLSGLSSTAVEQRAKAWLASEKSPPAQLLGASWSLGGPQRAAAQTTLRKLANDPDVRIAHMAEAQLWRTNIATVARPELDAWQVQIERMPPALRVGPYLVLAKGLAGNEARQAAAWNYLRAPILSPARHALAAQGLEAAAGELVKLSDISAASALYRELVRDYHDTPSGQVAEQKLKTLGAEPVVAAHPAAEMNNVGFVAGLRQRHLFTLAEVYCQDRLQDPKLADLVRATLTIEGLRTMSQHAYYLPPAEREKNWLAAQALAAKIPQEHPQRLAIDLEAALVTLQAAEMARQESDPTAKNRLLAAKEELVALEKQVGEVIALHMAAQRTPLGPDELSTADLIALRRAARLELLRAQRELALCDLPRSAQRTAALTQVSEQLAALRKELADDDPLTWQVRLAQGTCARLLGEDRFAMRQFEKLLGDHAPPDVMAQARAELARIHLAAKQPFEAYQILEAGRADGAAPSAQLEFAMLETRVAQWREALVKDDADNAERFRQDALVQVALLEKQFGVYWSQLGQRLVKKLAVAPNMHGEAMPGIGALRFQHRQVTRIRLLDQQDMRGSEAFLIGEQSY